MLHEDSMRRLVFILLLTTSLCAQSAPLMLGALEDTHGTYADDQYYRSLRALFYKSGTDWKSFPSDCISEECLRKLAADFPRETTWTIAFDGRNLGQVKSRIPPEIETYSRAGQQQILGTGLKRPVPTIGQRTQEFAGFMDDPVYRPLVAISQPNFKDPDIWKPVTLDAATVAVVRHEFRNKYPKITDCEVEELRDYRDVDIKILNAYGSHAGWRLISTSIKGCDIDDLRGDGLSLEWFALDPTGVAHYLNGNMRLVDAGDYDNSGHSQLLFMIDDYNRGGYRLYYDNFQKEVVFEYTFH
jgi:hypothetical protein